MDKIEQKITCPITYHIFYDPVVAKDGFTYEKTYIENWFKTNNNSPMTGKIIDKTLCPNFIVKQMVDEYLSIYPNKKIEQFVPQIIWNYNDFKDLTIEKQKEYLDNCIDLECECENKWRPIHIVWQYGTPEIIKYMIDKDVNLECEIIIIDIIINRNKKLNSEDKAAISDEILRIMMVNGLKESQVKINRG